MKSRATSNFWKSYARLPYHEQQRARKMYQIWRNNPFSPGLRFKRVSASEPIYSARTSDNYRAVGLMENDTMIWFWIGPHDEYERLLKQR
ncbi:MAG: hypothetical protein HDKAJFGB_03382 [Anaerolineae bacterium]|nr:hypothetical protein [Anaerolineae bacterium]